MKQATQLAGALRQELESGAEGLAKQLKDSKISEAEFVAVRLRISRNLSSAVEAGMLLHQSLLRVVAKSASVEQTMGLAECIDRARVQTFEVERLVALDAGGAASAVIAGPLQRLVDGARHVEGCVRILSEGEQAAAVLADRANMKAAPATQPISGGDRSRRRGARSRICVCGGGTGASRSRPDLMQGWRRKGCGKELMAAPPIDSAGGRNGRQREGGDPEYPPLAERLASGIDSERCGRIRSDPPRDLQMPAGGVAAGRAPMHEADALIRWAGIGNFAGDGALEPASRRIGIPTMCGRRKR
jgi:hypothetical protein